MTELENRPVTRVFMPAFLTAAALLATACGDGATEPEPQPNRAPVAQGSIPAQTVPVGESVTVSVASAFSDPDGDALTYAAASSATGVASVAVAGADVTVTGVAKGMADITVTASDPEGLSVQQAFQVTVPNRAPAVTGSIPGQTVQVGVSVSLNLAEHFSDPDGDALTYTGESSDAGVASVAVAGSSMTINGVAAGTATAAVTATDPDGQSASLGVEVTVRLSERDVLELFYEATGGENWIRDDNWLTDAPLGEWYGVTVNDEGAVVSLDLPVSLFDLLDLDGNGLTGSIPPELAQLSSLEVLDLSDNELTGPIPTELADLSALKALDLEFNDLTGPVPRELSELSSLEVLDLSDNELTGPIPPELAKLSPLEVLDLASNDLSGSIPPELGRLAALKVLDLSMWFSDNELTGPIPPELGRLSALQVLRLTSNDLSGPIPPELGRLSALEDLRLSLNDLTGPIPPELGQLAALEDLWLGFNDLTGPIPAAMGQLSALKTLVAYGNDLAGPLPSELGQLSQLGTLLINGNELTDPFPASFTSLGEVWWLEWQSNAGLCAPLTVAFDAWLAGIESQFLGSWSGPRCGAGYANRGQPTAVSSAELRHLEDWLAAETRATETAKDRREALAARKLVDALRSQMEKLPNELRSGPRARRDGGPR